VSRWCGATGEGSGEGGGGSAPSPENVLVVDLKMVRSLGLF